ncbi:hypothetical protein NEOLEDRAFT_348859 [Neolentinus lepideus HHB14362 ss-1]|uniref:Uncharacterized protein n=1 Tax=Neolentinus lepideus HHB14362 ss-1 TaxID=1314782 RepID=A0A165SRA5_9AGAM|nr:hypothetical protein NEOLEDRAFT_348859 [Neolentinus lepideus HHB14362 ss-1]
MSSAGTNVSCIYGPSRREATPTWFHAQDASGRRKNVDMLPWEILSYIFLHLVQSYDNLSVSCMDTPVLLSHVCSHWREVSTSTPELWKTVALRSSLTARSTSRSTSFLHRSKSLPLDLLLDFRDPRWRWNEENHIFSADDMKDVLCLLLPAVHRWGSLTLLTDTWAPIHTFLSQTSCVTSAPMLRELSLFRCNAYFVRKDQAFLPVKLKEPVSLFGDQLTGLRRVTLAGVHVDWASSCLRNLQALELKFHAYEVSPSLQEFLRILRECPALEKLSLLGWATRLDIQASANQKEHQFGLPSLCTHLELPCLKELDIGFVDMDHTAQILAFFHCPKLEELSLEDVAASMEYQSPIYCDPLLGYLANRRDFQTIRCLQLHQIYASYASIMNLLSSYPHVSCLTLDKMDETVLEVLKSWNTMLGGAAPFCPGLKELHCRSIPAHLVAECVFERMRLSSLDTPGLQHVVIDISGSNSVDEISDTVYQAFAIMNIKLQVLEDDLDESDWSRRGSFASVHSFSSYTSVE